MALISLPQREAREAIKRKPLTKKQRDKLFHEYNGICCLCEKQIIGKWRDEHINALHLGGSNEWKNRGPAHIHCALEKDKRDAKLIAKGRRLRGETGNTDKRKIPSRPMVGTIASGIKIPFNGKPHKRG